MRKNKNEILSSNFDKTKITCSFLVPKSLYNGLPLKSRKGIGRNLEYLLRKYRNRILKIKRIHKKTATALYQEKGNDLIKFNVRISPIFWEELTILSRSHGISNCYLYHLFLKWELLHEKGNLIFQTHPHLRTNQKLVLIWMIDFKEEYSQRMAQLVNEFSSKVIQ
ncbi:DUF1564 family protein [Leptospira sp. 201903070]|uniref:DUF1564 family protein n=1 Tax=Leptospira ainlahdjerensis TaxID=2810033 RepID=A0ABS2UJG6_9LEPT|nr:DUF1564 family protein [Leptospira ainlahdjerensis]MBM9579275.1 DUF1564 family protein [Leptospira ainlahdjerensis]